MLHRFRHRVRPGMPARMLVWAIVALIVLVMGVRASAYWRKLAGEMALSDATDLVTGAINDTVNRKLKEGNYGYEDFVILEKDNNGAIAAITANMASINSFSTEVLGEVVTSAGNGDLDIRVPIGTLLGFNITVGRGPSIPVDIQMLTSSRSDFRNELVSSGINQTKHQIILEVTVDIDVLIPWQTLSTQVVCQTLIAETVIVGQVPETFVSLE